jgi:hypothetical protein
VSSTVRCSRAGKYEAKRLQNLLRLTRSDRRDNVPDVASLLKTREYMRYGMRSGHASGMAQRRKKMERKMGIDMVCQSTASVCKRRCTGTFRGAHRMLCRPSNQLMVQRRENSPRAFSRSKVGYALTQIAPSRPQRDGRLLNVTFHHSLWQFELF